MSGKKKRSTELAYVKRHGNYWALRRREELKRAKGESTVALPEARSTGRRNDARPFLDPSKPAVRACRSIPLDRKDDGKAEVGPPRDSKQEATTTGGLPLSVAAKPSEPPQPAPPRASEPRPVVVADTSALLPHLEKLDSVVHDFVAALDQGALAATAGASGSSNASRFMRLLEFSPSTKAQVLGPPVLLGASPPIGLESLLGFLSSLHATGILCVQADDVTFMVSVVNGDVVHGVSHPRPEPELLGNILVARGMIDPLRLGRFFEECGSSASRIGEALNKQALVSTVDLRKALEQQMQQLFDRLFDSKSSEWCFYAGEATLAYIDMRMNVIRVLLESARKHDEGRAR